jgi:predicted secreted Zn-dependent protease
VQAFLRCLLLSILFLVVTSLSVGAAPTVTEQTVYYNLRGATARDLRAQMNKFGVMEKDGKTYDGYANSNVDWRYLYNSNRSSCWITSVKTIVRIKYTFPKWVDRSNAPPELRRKWDEFISALIGHERGHRDIAVEAASQIERAIAGMRPRRSCKALEIDANALGHRLLSDCRKRQAEYDARTRHGRTQGVRFP